MRKLLGLALFFAVGSALAVTVSMTSPNNGALYLAPATLLVKANASASGVGINRVEFYANGTLIGTDTTSPYQFDWSIRMHHRMWTIRWEGQLITAKLLNLTTMIASVVLRKTY